MKNIKIILPIVITVAFSLVIIALGNLTKIVNTIVSDNKYINNQLSYQLFLLGIALISLFITFSLNRKAFSNYFKFGKLSAPSSGIVFFRIKQGTNWVKTGLLSLTIISGGTAIFMFFMLRSMGVNGYAIVDGIPWIILFSLTNSFSEEMIFRVGIVATLKGLVKPEFIFIASGVLFGLPHLAGMPNGIIGAVMASLLGWVLAKSVYETNGFFWAWLIHFIQDVIIIGAIYLINSGV